MASKTPGAWSKINFASDRSYAVDKGNWVEIHYPNGVMIIINVAGVKEWYQDNNLHRVGAPAIIWPDGMKEWYQDNKRHREDGPAIEDPDEERLLWFYRGRNYGEGRNKPEGFPV